MLEVADRSEGAFEGHVAVVELARVSSAELVLDAVARSLGVQDAGNRELADSVVAHLRERRVLVVLDNCEHVLDAAAAVAELLLRAPRVHLLATSREALRLRTEHVYALSPLAVPDVASGLSVSELHANPSIALFVTRARQARASFALDEHEGRAVADLCVALDGLPLAIELAAARVRMLTPRAIHARLADRLDVLTATERDVPERQRTLRATFDWSYQLLDPAQQALLRRAAIFAGGFSLELCTLVCETPARVLDDVSALVDRSLLHVNADTDGEPRFRLLETVRDCALEKLRDCGELESTQARRVDWALRLTASAAARLNGPGQADCLDQLEREHDNLRAALAWCRQYPLAEEGAAIAAELWRFWSVRGHLTEGQQWLEYAWGEDGRSGVSDVLRARLLRRASHLAFRRGAYARAAALQAASAARLADDADSIERAEALQSRGGVAVALGNVREALPLLEQGAALYRAGGDAAGLAWYAYNLGLALLQAEDVAGGSAALRTCVEDSRVLGHSWLLGASLAALGLLNAMQNNWEAAATQSREALTIARDLRDRWSIGHALTLVAWVASAGRCWQRAARLFGAAGAGLEAIGAAHWGPTQALHAAQVERVRASLSESAFETAWGEGRAWSLDQSIAYALQVAGVGGRDGEARVQRGAPDGVLAGVRGVDAVRDPVCAACWCEPAVAQRSGGRAPGRVWTDEPSDRRGAYAERQDDLAPPGQYLLETGSFVARRGDGLRGP